jgi:restriction endonuclease S subunit
MSKHKIYICQICNTTPDQISHHKTHLESQKHKDKREILKLKLSKLSESELIEDYNTSNIDEIISNKETFYYYEKLNNNSDETEELQKMSELVKNISNREALRDKIHEIHNFLRNSGAGYGMNALKVFNFLYGLKKIEAYGLIDKYGELKRPECEFSHLLQKAKEAKDDEITELILSKISECVKKSPLSRVLYYELPQNIKANVFSHLVKEIESISEIEKTCNVLLSGKIYEYFIGRDETAISELGAYFTDRHIVNYILRKLNPVLLENGLINDMIDMFGGSGGFTTGYVDYLNEKYPDQIDWNTEINKIHHYDINEDVIKSASLEILCMTRELPNVENITYRNAFASDFGERNFTYILTNPPYGGDKNKQSDIQIKREKIKNFIKSQIATNSLDAETLKNRNIQLKKIEKEERQEKKESEKTKVCLSSCSDRIQIFAKNHKLTGSDKESCSLILMMELLAKNGTAIGVLKEGVFFNKTYKDLRKCLIENFNVVEIISVPQDQFENTSTKTSIVIFQNTEQKTTEVKFSDLVVEKNEVDEFAELNGEICMTKNKGDISSVSDKLVSIASVEDILFNQICSLNAKDYNKKVIVCGDGYELKTLGEICRDISTNKNIASSDRVDGKFRFFTCSREESTHNEYHYEGTFIIHGSRGSTIKESIFMTNNEKFAIGTSMIISEVKNKCESKYIYYYLKLNQSIFNKYINGSAIPMISKSNYYDIKIPIPKSQAKIQEWVDKISRPYDKMNSNKSRINELETFVQIRIKEICENEDCDEVELGSICKYIKSGKAINNENRKGTLYPYYAANGISGYVDEYIFDGKYIICAQDGSIGATHLVNCKFYASNHVWILKINDAVNPYYVYSILKNNVDYTKIISGSVIPKLTKEKLSTLKINIPKNKKLIQDLDPTFQEIETLQNEMKEAESEYKKLIKELSEEAIPNQEEQSHIPDMAPEPEQPDVVDEPIQDEIVIKKKSSTKSVRKLK